MASEWAVSGQRQPNNASLCWVRRWGVHSRLPRPWPTRCKVCHAKAAAWCHRRSAPSATAARQNRLRSPLAHHSIWGSARCWRRHLRGASAPSLSVSQTVMLLRLEEWGFCTKVETANAALRPPNHKTCQSHFRGLGEHLRWRQSSIVWRRRNPCLRRPLTQTRVSQRCGLEILAAGRCHEVHTPCNVVAQVCLGHGNCFAAMRDRI